MKKVCFGLLFCFLFFVGCGSSSSSNNKSADKTQKEKELYETVTKNKINSGEKVDYDQLRKKANVAEAASMVGYDGKAIKKELNKIIDEREKMDNQLKDLGY